jgi:zinc protease
VAQPYISRSYLAPERDSGAQTEAAALKLLAEVLGGGTTSYLTEKLQFDSQVAVYSSAYYRGTSLDDTTFNLIVVPAPGVTLQDAEDAMDAAIAEFMKDGVDADQLARLKKQLRAQQIYARDNVDGIAQRYGSALTTGLTVADVQAWPDIMQTVTAEDIMAAAKKVMIPETSVTGWLVKAKEQTQ